MIDKSKYVYMPVERVIESEKERLNFGVDVIRRALMDIPADSNHYKEFSDPENGWIHYGWAYYLVSIKNNELNLSIKNEPDGPILTIIAGTVQNINKQQVFMRINDGNANCKLVELSLFFDGTLKCDMYKIVNYHVGQIISLLKEDNLIYYLVNENVIKYAIDIWGYCIRGGSNEKASAD